MRLFKTLVACMCLIPAGAGFLAAQDIVLGSVDVGITNDFPIGAYQDKSAYNLGFDVQLNVGFEALPWLRVAARLDNNYWLAIPAWISFGTQINASVIAGVQFPLAAIPGVGGLSLGGELSYGGMAHIAVADTTGTGATTFFFIDQVIGATLEASLRFENLPLGIIIKPRYFISPEQSDLKHQFGIIAGVRFYLADTEATSEEASE